jgi:uncharacterized Zn finger protein
MSKCKNCKYKQKVLRKVIPEKGELTSVFALPYICPECGMSTHIYYLCLDPPNYCAHCGIGFLNLEMEMY